MRPAGSEIAFDDGSGSRGRRDKWKNDICACEEMEAIEKRRKISHQKAKEKGGMKWIPGALDSRCGSLSNDG